MVYCRKDICWERNNPNLFTAFDTTGGKKEYLGAQHIMLNLIGSIYIHVSKDTLCVNGDLTVSGSNSQISSIDFGDGTIVTDNYVNHTYTQVGSYTIKLVGINSCNESFEYLKKVEVRNDLQPKPEFYTPYDVVCPGELVHFYPGSQSKSSNYTWNFGDGITSTKDYLDHSWANVGTYQVTLTETNSCGLTKSQVKDIDISSNKKITRADVYASTKLACPNTNIRFNVYNRQSYKSIVLDYGDNTTSKVTDEFFEHTYATPGKYYPKVTLSNFCNHDTTIFLDTIAIRGDLKWGIEDRMEIDLEDSVCPGAPFHYDVYSPNALSYTWDFGVELTIENLMVHFLMEL